MIIKETIKKEISLTIDDIKDLILRDLNIEEKEGVIVTISEEVSKQSIDRRLKNINIMIENTNVFQQGV